MKDEVGVGRGGVDDEDEPGSRRFRELIRRERADMQWLVHAVACLYDEISGGRISKPMTYPGHVIDAFHERMTEATDEARTDAFDDALMIVKAHVVPIGEDVTYSRGWEAARASIEREISEAKA